MSSGVFKDPADVIEKPLHLLGLHRGAAIAVAVVVAALILSAAAMLLLRHRQASPS